MQQEDLNKYWQFAKSGDEKAFQHIYIVLYAKLKKFSISLGVYPEDAEDLVADVFLNLWKNRAQITLDGQLQSYCLRAVKNASLNLKNSARQRYLSHDSPKLENEHWQPASENTQETLNANELSETIERLLEQMPPMRKKIFMMSREAGLSYKEIAEVLDISKKTVENHIGIALSYLKEHLYNNKSKNSA
ncbi:RNA polymerase sigma-70 factor [Limibacter armeniacum]|uniref:RNA polymerase sigma-70 factor n=1 Tax=Limibacter armeniacum TaxID=466084 RepID=UPI002FE61FD7